MKKTGIILLVILVFMACQKEEEEEIVSPPNTNVTTTVGIVNLPMFTGLYFGTHYNLSTSPGSGGSSTSTGDAYAIVDSIGVDNYRFIIAEDSLLTGAIYDTIDINFQNQPLKPCDVAERYTFSLPGGAIHVANLEVRTCDSLYISRDYRPFSSHSGSGDSFVGSKLN